MNAKLKSILNATWKVGCGLIGLAAIGIGILLAAVWYENTYGRAYGKDKTLSKDIRLQQQLCPNLGLSDGQLHLAQTPLGIKCSAA